MVIAFKFPMRHHLGFYDVTALSYCFKKKISAFQQ